MTRTGITIGVWALLGALAACGPAWGAPTGVRVHVAGQTLVVPVPPDLAVGSPQLLSAEQSAATSARFRLVSVLTPRHGPRPGQSVRLVLVETMASDGTVTPSEFSRMKRLARSNVHALAVPISAGKAETVNAARVLIDTDKAFAWLAPVEAEGGTGAAQNRALAGTLYILVNNRLLALSLHSSQASVAEAQWIEREMHWLLTAVRKANPQR